MNGLIVAGGNWLNKKVLEEYCFNSQIIVAADSGIESLLSAGCTADYLIGDFDSIKKETLIKLQQSDIQLLKYPVEKDDTDTELGLNLLLELGCKNIVLIGVIGSRLDHTLANISTLRNLHFKGVKAKIIDNNNIIEYLGEEESFEKKENLYISIVPISFDGVVVSLEGFYFSLKNQKINYGSSLGISNYLVNNIGTVIKHSGEAIIIQSRD